MKTTGREDRSTEMRFSSGSAIMVSNKVKVFYLAVFKSSEEWKAYSPRDEIREGYEVIGRLSESEEIFFTLLHFIKLIRKGYGIEGEAEIQEEIEEIICERLAERGIDDIKDVMILKGFRLAVKEKPLSERGVGWTQTLGAVEPTKFRKLQKINSAAKDLGEALKEITDPLWGLHEKYKKKKDKGKEKPN